MFVGRMFSDFRGETPVELIRLLPETKTPKRNRDSAHKSPKGMTNRNCPRTKDSESELRNAISPLNQKL